MLCMYVLERRTSTGRGASRGAPFTDSNSQPTSPSSCTNTVPSGFPRRRFAEIISPLLTVNPEKFSPRSKLGFTRIPMSQLCTTCTKISNRTSVRSSCKRQKEGGTSATAHLIYENSAFDDPILHVFRGGQQQLSDSGQRTADSGQADSGQLSRNYRELQPLQGTNFRAVGY
eukprot:1191084-Prorocentrum_minimum.AAC.3